MKNTNYIMKWIGIIGVGSLLRWINISSRSIWLDEAYSLKLAAYSPAAIIKGAAMDIHPPLFHLILAGWIKIFGTGEWALRSLSAFFSVLLIPVSYKLVSVLVNKRAGWVAALLVACSPYFIELSRMGRMPSLFALLVTACIYFYWQTLYSKKTINALGFCLTMLAALYTHYFSILLFGAFHFYIFAGIGKLNLSRKVRKKWFLLQLVLLAGYAPWFITLWDHLVKGGPGWRGVGAVWHEPIHIIYNLIVGTACWQMWHKITAVGLLAIAGIIIIWKLKNNIKTIYAQMQGRAWGLLVTILIVVFGGVWLYSTRHLNVFDYRYLSMLAIVLLVIISTIIVTLEVKWQRVVIGILLLAFSVPVVNLLFNNQYYDNWRGVAGVIEKTVPRDAVIAVYPAWNENPLNYYLKDAYKLIGLPGYYHPVTGQTRPYFHINESNMYQVENRLSKNRNVLLLLINDGKEQRLLNSWFEEHYQIAFSKQADSIYYQLGKKKE